MSSQDGGLTSLLSSQIYLNNGIRFEKVSNFNIPILIYYGSLPNQFPEGQMANLSHHNLNKAEWV